MSQLGGRSACHDAAAALEALVNAPEGEVAAGSCAALMAAEAPAALVKVGKGERTKGCSCVGKLRNGGRKGGEKSWEEEPRAVDVTQ
jgi:hypothetical protein